MADLIPGKLYVSFASRSTARWARLRGCALRHTERGYGRVEAIDPRNGNPLVTILFDGSAEPVRLNIVAFQEGRIDIELSQSIQEEPA